MFASRWICFWFLVFKMKSLFVSIVQSVSCLYLSNWKTDVWRLTLERGTNSRSDTPPMLHVWFLITCQSPVKKSMHFLCAKQVTLIVQLELNAGNAIKSTMKLPFIISICNLPWSNNLDMFLLLWWEWIRNPPISRRLLIALIAVAFYSQVTTLSFIMNIGKGMYLMLLHSTYSNSILTALCVYTVVIGP